jgi:hypothetical protein
MKHIVLIKHNKPEKFNYCKFGNYTDSKGKKRVLIDPNGDKLDGFALHQALLSLDINDEDHKRIHEFLKDHPLIRGKFTITDTKAQQEDIAKESLLKAEAITKASEIQDSELKDLAILTGIDKDLENKIIKAKLIQLSNNQPQKFLDLINDVDKQHRVFLKKALDKKVLTKVNGIWKHGTMSIGMTDDQAILWLKDNGDVYAILKAQVRGNIPVEKKEEPVVVEEGVYEEAVISSSTMQAINEAPVKKTVKKK